LFPWKGKIEKCREAGIILKTKQELENILIKRTKEMHSYEIPCIVSWKIKGSRDFLNWITEVTK